MTPRSRPPMFANDRDFPEPVIEVLFPQRAKRRPHGVPGANARILPDRAARQRQPKVPLVILIAPERFIETADARKCFAPPAAEINRVNETFPIDVMRFRAA